MNMAASLAWCCISISTCACFCRRANGRLSGGRLFGKIVRHMLRRQGASTLRSLVLTAASSGRARESSGTSGGLRGRPRGLAAALSEAATPLAAPHPVGRLGCLCLASTPFHNARAVAHPVVSCR